MKPILVTGANGFVGRHLVRSLIDAGRPVMALDLEFRADFPAEAERQTGTVTDAALMRSLAAESAGVIHAAAIAQLWAARPGAHDAVNYEGTVAVASAAQAAGVRLLLVSSYTTLVARSTVPTAVLTEAEAHAPETLLGPYPASKRRAEIAVDGLIAEGLDAVTVLPSAPVGPGDAGPTPPGRMILDLARGATPAIIATELDLVDVRSLASGILAAFDHGESGERFLLSGEAIGLGRFAELVCTTMGRRAPKIQVPFAMAETVSRIEELIGRGIGRAPTAPLTGVLLAKKRARLDSGKARHILGFRPAPLQDAVLSALEWFAGEGMLRTGPVSPAAR
ncbi:MAG: NAD-dependent epimerase/dehydratase family protein [Pseudomonadota bacterium]